MTRAVQRVEFNFHLECLLLYNMLNIFILFNFFSKKLQYCLSGVYIRGALYVDRNRPGDLKGVQVDL